MREDHPKHPADLYGSIKVVCEEVGQYYRETYGIEFIALRFVSIYGPGKEARHGPLSFYGQLIEKAREGGKWVVPQGGDQQNDSVYVGDVARSVYLALKAAKPGEWVFNIGTGEAWTPRDFLNAAARMFPEHQIELGPGPSKLGRSKQSYCVFDILAARKHLGYEPAYDVERGVRDYVATLELIAALASKLRYESIVLNVIELAFCFDGGRLDRGGQYPLFVLPVKGAKRLRAVAGV